MNITELVEKHMRVNDRLNARIERKQFSIFAIELLEMVKPKEPDLKHEECLDWKEGFIDGTRSAQQPISKALQELRKIRG